MEFKGTSAPWDLNKRPDGFNIEDGDNSGFVAYVPKQDNANLIAAAPELLESLRELVSAMERYEMDVDERAPVKHREMMNKANSAIAKALGEDK